MHVITEHISCVCNEAEFPEAIKSFSDVYIVTKVGTILRHSKLKGGRHIRVEVKEIPGLKMEEVKPDVHEEINFLPNGRIPALFLDELVQFFREVMNIKKAEQEAMAHVLYNEKDKANSNRGYRISIPNQIVSKASVRYETDHIHQGDIIVLDIHSHNTMGAFFSGTDNGDDRISIGYSGVVGRLDKSEPEYIWRFNVNDVKRKVEVFDIFDIPKKEVKIPAEWLEKVKTSYGYNGGPGSSTGGPHAGKGRPQASGWDGKHGKHNAGGRENGRERGIGNGFKRDGLVIVPDWVRYPPGYEDIQTDMFDGDSLEASPGGPVQQQQHQPDHTIKFEDQDRGAVGHQIPKVIDFRDMSLRDYTEHLAGRGNGDIEVVDSLPLGGGNGPFLSNKDEYDLNVCEYGKDAAEAFDQIETYLGDLEGCDELLLPIIRMCYGLLSAEAQGRLADRGF